MGVRSQPAEELATITERLLSDGSTHGEQRQAAHEFLALTRKLAWPAVAADAADAETSLPSGQALSPESAAHCAADTVRTRTWMRGLAAAVAKAEERFPGERLHVLYAGCGPLAALALAVIGSRPGSKLRVTLVDIHPFSIAASKRLIRALGWEDRIDLWIQGDATELSFRPETRFHVVVVEVMQRALDREGQVAVTLALTPWLVPGGILVPERIRVSLEATEGRAGFDPADAGTPATPPRLRHLATLFELTRDTRSPPPPEVVVVPGDVVGGGTHAVLATEIAVFGEEILRAGDSGLTCLKPLLSLGTLVAGERLACRYRMGRDPGFTCTPLDRPEGWDLPLRRGILERSAAEEARLPPAPAEILGQVALARFWDRARRARAGGLGWSEDELAQDAQALAGLGLSLEAAMAYTFQARPCAEAFGAWVREIRGERRPG